MLSDGQASTVIEPSSPPSARSLPFVLKVRHLTMPSAASRAAASPAALEAAPDLPRVRAEPLRALPPAQHSL